MEERKKSSNGIRILIVLLILLMIVAGVLVAIKFIQGNKIKQTQTSAGVEENKEPEKEVIKLPTTFAGIPSLFLLKSIILYFFLAPPPRCLTVILP